MLARLVELGYPVLLPFGDNERYDFVIESSPGVFSRIQVKTGKLLEDRGVVSIPVSSSQNHRGRGRQDYHGDVDFIIAYCPQLDKIYRLDIDDVGKSEVALRVSPSQGGGSSPIRWATEYELNKPQ